MQAEVDNVSLLGIPTGKRDGGYMIWRNKIASCHDGGLPHVTTIDEDLEDSPTPIVGGGERRVCRGHDSSMVAPK